MKNLLLLLVSIFVVACSTTKTAISTQSEIETIKEDVYILASDEFLGRETGTEGERLAAEYIIKEFKELGVKSFKSMGGYKQPFPFSPNPHFNPDHGHPTGDDNTGHNLIGYLDNGSNQYILIGAHYDHLGMGGPFSLDPEVVEVHNGADDNASGVASLFSIARHLKTKDLNSNIIIVAFSGEEFGLWGSKYLIDHLPIEKEQIRFMINLDMVGRLSEEKELVVNGTGTSSIWDDVLDSANKNVGLNLIRKKSGSGPSDHSVFYRDSMAVLAMFTGQHEDYHKATDDAHKLNYPGIAMITELTGNIIDLADDYETIDFIKTKDAPKRKMDFKVTFGITPDYVYQGEGLRIDGVRSERPAENAGLKGGDIVIKIGEYDIKDIYDYMEVLGKFEQGQTTTVEFKRNDNVMVTQLTF